MAVPKLYVCGFLFHRGAVLLVEKKAPEWQAGLWNGVGGKVEKDETVQQAIVREFHEETGLETWAGATHGNPWWHNMCTERYRDDYKVCFFRADVLAHEPRPLVPERNDAGEWLQWRSLSFLEDSMAKAKVVGNLHWLLPMAMDPRMCTAELFVGADIRKRPTW